MKLIILPAAYLSSDTCGFTLDVPFLGASLNHTLQPWRPLQLEMNHTGPTFYVLGSRYKRSGVRPIDWSLLVFQNSVSFVVLWNWQ